MEVSKVSREDGLACANLINFLKSGRWDLTGNDIAAHHNVLKWVQSMAVQMAEQLREAPAKPAGVDPAAQTMRITKIGPIGSGKPTRKNSRKSK